jgi:putative YphP/YqiW family bacilliredoxin
MVRGGLAPGRAPDIGCPTRCACTSEAEDINIDRATKTARDFIELQYPMPYPEFFVEPMRRELTNLGVQELRTPADVDAAIAAGPGTLMIVVNSVCGCAAGKARPGIALALRHANTPDRVATVFAGADVEATDRARSYFTGYPPSSPSIALFRDGSLVYMLERRNIENRDAYAIATELTNAFDKFCAQANASNG